MKLASTQGYAQEADQLLERYEKIPFETAHASILDLIPYQPCKVIDIGSGTGRDAAYLSELGHEVLAVEPTDELRIPASRLHPSPIIEWVDDGLPTLAKVMLRGDRFDLVMLTAVWMHLDAGERQKAMPAIASLMRPEGVMIMSLRHGPVPAGRRMFDVSADETIALAELSALRPIRNHHAKSVQHPNKQAGVTWTRLAFEKRIEVGDVGRCFPPRFDTLTHNDRYRW